MSFESLGTDTRESPPRSREVKYPLRRVQVTVNNFLRVVAIDLSRLQQHRSNIEKLHSSGNLVSLHKEQTNATLTVQQLKRNVRLVEHTRTQVLSSDLPQFDRQVETVQADARNAVHDLMALLKTTESLEPSTVTTSTHTEPTHAALLSVQQSDNVQLLRAEQSLHNLQQNVQELNDLMNTFSHLVHDQGGTVDAIEDHVSTAENNVNQGTKQLAKAARVSAAMLPVTGGLVGALVGGPLGLVIGVKAGAAAALAGGIAGFSGGRYIRSRKQAEIDSDERQREQTSGEEDDQATTNT